MSATSGSVDFHSSGRRITTPAKPDGIRVISFRKTNKRAAKLYGKPQTID